MTAPVGVWIPIMCLPMLFQGEEGGTRETYRLNLDIESLAGSPSSRTMWRRSECGLLVGRAGDEGGTRLRGASLGGDDGHTAGILARVGTCADELRLMGVNLAVYVADRGGAGGGWGSSVRNFSRAKDPP
jgi:hypothetical protein